MERKKFDLAKYGMVICPCCNSRGYIHYPARQACPKCGGFGFIARENEDSAKLEERHERSDKNITAGF
jgi:uncharacterized OB-fold protein